MARTTSPRSPLKNLGKLVFAAALVVIYLPVCFALTRFLVSIFFLLTGSDLTPTTVSAIVVVAIFQFVLLVINAVLIFGVYRLSVDFISSAMKSSRLA